MRITKKYDLDDLAARIEAARRPSDESHAGVRFDAFEIESIRSVLDSCIDFQPDIPDVDRRGLIWGGIVDAAGKGVVTAAALQTALKKREVGYLKRPLEPFVLATSINLGHFDTPGNTSVRGARVTFSRALPKRFSRKDIERRLSYVRVRKAKQPFLHVRVFVRARTPTAAHRLATSRFDLLRGIWNYRINSGTAMRLSNGTHRAVNEVRLGPIDTLHRPNGQLATGTFWYRSVDQQTEDVVRSIDWTAQADFVRSVLTRLTGIPYREVLETLFVRYCRAFDEPDPEVAFIKLWGVHERLIGCVGDYRHIARRVGALFRTADRLIMTTESEHLLDVRNDVVHLDRSREAMETYLFQLKYLVECEFKYHLRRGRRYESLATATAFLDYPTDTAVLDSQLKALAEARAFFAE